MSKEIRQYKETIIGIFDKIEAQSETIAKAAEVMADAIARDEVIHVVGTGGHSCMAAEELLWRAGGLAPINAVLDAGVNLVHGAKRSNIIERCEGYAKTLFASYSMGEKPGEVIIIANAYGINAMTIDTALEAKKRGMSVIAVTAKSFGDNVPPGAKARHSTNKNLYELADIFVDCSLPYGDAVVELEGMDQRVAPTSTFCNAFTVNCLVIETVKALLARGITPPVWISANMPGGDEANKALEQKYFGRIKHLK